MRDLFLNQKTKKKNQINKKTATHPTRPKALKTKTHHPQGVPILYYQNLWHNKIKSFTFTPSSASLTSPALIKQVFTQTFCLFVQFKHA